MRMATSHFIFIIYMNIVLDDYKAVTIHDVVC